MKKPHLELKKSLQWVPSQIGQMKLLTVIPSGDAFEQILYQHVCKLILADNIQKAFAIEKRRVSFWAIADPIGILRWTLLDTASKLIDVAIVIKKELQGSTLTC